MHINNDEYLFKMQPKQATKQHYINKKNVYQTILFS